MMNQKSLDACPVKDGFRLRGEQITRLETFVDAAFAFAVTLLVISAGTMPSTARELLEALKRIPTFGICFALLSMFWLAHNRWSRRYGLDDAYTAFLSLLLVFVALIFVYPLRLVMSSALAFFTQGWLPSEMTIKTTADLQTAFLIYGLGWTALSLIVWLHFRTALRRETVLELNPLELLETRRDAGMFFFLALFGLISILLTFVVRTSSIVWVQALPGFVYSGIAGVQVILHINFNRERARLERG